MNVYKTNVIIIPESPATTSQENYWYIFVCIENYSLAQFSKNENETRGSTDHQFSSFEKQISTWNILYSSLSALTSSKLIFAESLQYYSIANPLYRDSK